MLATRYRLRASDKNEAGAMAERIALEQSAELPRQVVDRLPEDIPTGRIDHLEQLDSESFALHISWPVALFDDDPLQLINVLFGNISLLPGIRLEFVDWNPITNCFYGPYLGIDGIREKLGITDRALSCTALKPIGLSPEDLAELTGKFARGGIDLIKDDHGLADQKSAPFDKRITACANVAGNEEQRLGRSCWYIPNVTSNSAELPKRLKACRNAGICMVMLCPHLTGLDSLTLPAEYELGVLAHPAFSGSSVLQPDSGIHPALLYGELWRAWGADGIIYPNSGGRFVLGDEDCAGINASARNPELPWKRAWPVPGGGIDRNSVSEWVQRYGKDTIFLIGGSLYDAPDGIEAASSDFRRALQNS